MTNMGRRKLIWTLQGQQVCAPGVGLPRATRRSLQWQSFREETHVDWNWAHPSILFQEVFWIQSCIIILKSNCVSVPLWKICTWDTKMQYNQFYLTDSCQSHQAFPGYAAFIMCLKAHFKMVGCAMGHHQPSVVLSRQLLVNNLLQYGRFFPEIPRSFVLWLSSFWVDLKKQFLNFIRGCFFAGGWPTCSVRKSATDCICDPSRNLWLHVYIFKLFHTSAAWGSQQSVYIYLSSFYISGALFYL